MWKSGNPSGMTVTNGEKKTNRTNASGNGSFGKETQGTAPCVNVHLIYDKDYLCRMVNAAYTGL